MGGGLAKELEKARDEQASELSFIRKSIKKVRLPLLELFF
jgi:hypothetical protein